MKPSRYMTRALKSRDPRFARILGKLGHTDPDAGPQRAEEPKAAESLEFVRLIGEDNSDTDLVEQTEEEAEAPEPEKPVKNAKPASKTKSKKTAKGGSYKRRDMRAED